MEERDEALVDLSYCKERLTQTRLTRIRKVILRETQRESGLYKGQFTF